VGKTTRRPRYETKSTRESTLRFENKNLIQLGEQLSRFPKSLMSRPRRKMLRQLKRLNAKTFKHSPDRIYRLIRGYEIRKSRWDNGKDPEPTICRHRSQWETKFSTGWRNHT